MTLVSERRKRLKDTIVEAWCDKVHLTPARGLFHTSRLRQGGATDTLIDLAVDKAMAEINAARAEGYRSGVEDGRRQRTGRI